MFDDLISKQAAIDALEKDIRMAKSEDGELWVAKINAQMKLTMLPSIESKRDEVVVNEACLNCELDCVEVVRCHNCRNYEEAKNSCNGFCKEWNTSTYTWDYCSRGERREDE